MFESGSEEERKCPKFASIQETLNNSWYVSFDTEEDTQRAQMHLQMNVRTFKGKQICVRFFSMGFYYFKVYPKVTDRLSAAVCLNMPQ